MIVKAQSSSEGPVVATLTVELPLRRSVVIITVNVGTYRSG